MQMSSSQFTRWARLCSAFVMASLVFVLLGLAGCGTGSSTSNCTQLASITSLNASSGVLSHTGGAPSGSASDLSTSLSARQALSPSVPHTQYRLGFWEQGIIAVAGGGDTSPNLPTNSCVSAQVNKVLPGGLS